MDERSRFFEIFDNYPDIDVSSTTSIQDIQQKFNCHPTEARELIDKALAEQLIVLDNGSARKVSYMKRYVITQKGYQLYLEYGDI